MELRECPFCGAQPKYEQYTDDGERVTSVYCVDCYAKSGRSVDAYSVEDWNTRHDDWQEISLAPTDGTVVDLWGGGARYPDFYWDGGVWVPVYYEAETPMNPTHFRHLPLAPKEGR